MSDITNAEFFEKVERSFLRATAAAIQENKRLGLPISVMRDGEVVEIPPEEIPDESAAQVAENRGDYGEK